MNVIHNFSFFHVLVISIRMMVQFVGRETHYRWIFLFSTGCRDLKKGHTETFVTIDLWLKYICSNWNNEKIKILKLQKLTNEKKKGDLIII